MLSEAVELSRRTVMEGEKLVHVDADDVVRVLPPLLGCDVGARVIAVHAVAVIAQPPHQLRPGGCDAVAVPTRLVGGTGEAEPGHVGDDDVKGVGRIVRAGERVDEADVLHEGVRPAMGEDQRCGVLVRRERACTKWIVCLSISGVKCGYLLSRASCSRQSYVVRQRSTRPLT